MEASWKEKKDYTFWRQFRKRHANIGSNMRTLTGNCSMPASLSTKNLLQASQILACPHILSANSKLSPVCTNSPGSRSKPCPDMTAKHSGAYSVEYHKGLPCPVFCMGLGEQQEASYSCCSTSTTLSRESAQRQTGVVTACASCTDIMTSTCMLTNIGFVSAR